MSLRNHLARLRDYIDESNLTNSNTDKINVLKKYKDDAFVTKVLHFTYNNQLQFNVSVDNLRKNDAIVAPENMYNAEGENGDNLFALLMDLHERKITGHHAIAACNAFYLEYKEFERELSYIVNRNLQTRVTATIINKTIPGLIPEFEVALGEDYDSLDGTDEFVEKTLAGGIPTMEKVIGTLAHRETNLDALEVAIRERIGTKYDKRPNLADGTWYASRKMDGLRATGFVDNESNTRFFSREGNEFFTFGIIAAKIKEMGFKNIILDGEMCLIAEDGSDDFNGMQQVFRKKDHTIENARYRIFDALTYEEFRNRKSTDTLDQRRVRFLMGDFAKNKWEREWNEFVQPIEQHLIKDQTHFEQLREHARKMKWEGLIVRKNIGYEGRRTKNLLKVKNFLEGEFLVVDVEMTNQRVIEDGKEITKEMLGAAFVDFHGVQVRVGSGYSKKEREMFHADKHLILGKMITVQYFETTKNKQGTSKMRFPTFKCIKERY